MGKVIPPAYISPSLVSAVKMPFTLNKVIGKFRSSHEKLVKPYPQQPSESLMHENYPFKAFKSSFKSPVEDMPSADTPPPLPVFMRPSISKSKAKQMTY